MVLDVQVLLDTTYSFWWPIQHEIVLELWLEEVPPKHRRPHLSSSTSLPNLLDSSYHVMDNFYLQLLVEEIVHCLPEQMPYVLFHEVLNLAGNAVLRTGSSALLHVLPCYHRKSRILLPGPLCQIRAVLVENLDDDSTDFWWLLHASMPWTFASCLQCFLLGPSFGELSEGFRHVARLWHFASGHLWHMFCCRYCDAEGSFGTVQNLDQFRHQYTTTLVVRPIVTILAKKLSLHSLQRHEEHKLLFDMLYSGRQSGRNRIVGLWNLSMWYHP